MIELANLIEQAFRSCIRRARSAVTVGRGRSRGEPLGAHDEHALWLGFADGPAGTEVGRAVSSTMVIDARETMP